MCRLATKHHQFNFWNNRMRYILKICYIMLYKFFAVFSSYETISFSKLYPCWIQTELLWGITGIIISARFIPKNRFVYLLNFAFSIFRCSLAGRDLNRNYKSVLKDSFPSVWHTKMMIKRLNMEREIILYCDLHGHSRKNNIFIYGCENKNNPQRKLKERVI